jgi:hypothetical protein
LRVDFRRIVSEEVRDRLATHGAVLLEGDKMVGKTTTALTLCASHVHLDRDAAARAAANVDPRRILAGQPPRLIDEYQIVPGISGAVRGEVDARRAKARLPRTPEPLTLTRLSGSCSSRTNSPGRRGSVPTFG